MNRTTIEWVKNPTGEQGYTWNPITGCLNGCDYCYARRLANGRLKHLYLANTNLPCHDESKHEAHHADPFYPRFWDSRLFDIHVGFCKGIFVCDMSDLFGIGIPKNWTSVVLNEIAMSSHRNRYYLLTKQPYNMEQFSPFPNNCWVGISVCNAEMLWCALEVFNRIEAKVKYLSFEPLQRCVFSDSWELNKQRLAAAKIDWIIIGAQTHPLIAPPPEATAMLISTAKHLGIPVFLKNNMKQALNVGRVMQEIPYTPS